MVIYIYKSDITLDNASMLWRKEHLIFKPLLAESQHPFDQPLELGNLNANVDV